MGDEEWCVVIEVWVIEWEHDGCDIWLELLLNDMVVEEFEEILAERTLCSLEAT